MLDCKNAFNKVVILHFPKFPTSHLDHPAGSSPSTITQSLKMPSLQLISDLPGHADPAWALTFNPSRPLLASCSTDRTVRLYSYTLPSPTTSSDSSQIFPSADSPKPRVEYLSTISTQHKKSIRSISWAPSGSTLATGSFDSTVGIWEEVDEDARAEGEDGQEGVFKPNKSSEMDVDGGDNSETRESEWECVTTLEGHESECKSVGYSSDGALLASCSRDRSVWVWEGVSAYSWTPSWRMIKRS